MRRLALVLSLAISAPIAGCGSSDSHAPGTDAAVDVFDQPLDAFVIEQMNVAKIPGMSAAIVKGGKIVWTGAWGLADLENKIAVKVDTIFLVASISKTFTASAAMRMVQEGKIKLDDDVNAYLPFKVRNPKWPDVPVTLRMLLTHTSSISEPYVKLVGLIGPGDSKMPLKDFCATFSAAADTWSSAKPGTTYNYSQVGTSLAALVVETLAGKPFDAYSKEIIIDALGMKDTSWRFAEVDASRVAVPYTYFPDAPRKIEHWGAPFYPAATIHTTAPELAKFLITFTQKDGRVLSPDSEAEMLKLQVPTIDANEALLWEHKKVEGEDTVGHGGGAPGVSTTMYFRQRDGVGVVTLTNSDVHIRVGLERVDQNAAYDLIEARLYREAAKY